MRGHALVSWVTSAPSSLTHDKTYSSADFDLRNRPSKCGPYGRPLLRGRPSRVREVLRLQRGVQQLSNGGEHQDQAADPEVGAQPGVQGLQGPRIQW